MLPTNIVVIGAGSASVAELCRRELAVVRLGVEAAVNGDRQAALQCLLLDPVACLSFGSKLATACVLAPRLR